MADINEPLEEEEDSHERRNRGQFPKGVSGNPNGRPKGAKGIKTIVQNAARRTVPMVVRGRRRNVMALEAVVTSMLKLALQGDRHARSDFLRFCDRYATDELQAVTKAALTETEQELLDSILGRAPKPEKEE